MAVVLEYVIGGLTAVCTSLVFVLLLWRLSRRVSSIRAIPPPCCDVTDLLAWLLDACHAVTGAAMLALVASDDVTCAVAGFLALLGGAQTLCLLATRAVVLATGHVDRDGSRDVEMKARCVDIGKVDDKRCSTAWFVPLIVAQLSVVTAFCALPLSQLPISTTTAQRNRTGPGHLTCLPLTLESRDTAAWGYSCFLLVAVGWLPLLVAVTTDVVDRCRARRRRSASSTTVGVLRRMLWTVCVVLLSVEVLATAEDRRRRAVVQACVAMVVDLATLMHVVDDVLHVRHCYVTQTRRPRQQQQQHLPARLTSVTRAPRQPVRLSY